MSYDIAKARALCEAVELGPWEPEIGTHACCVLACDRKQVAAALGLDTATFIAAARTLLPEALDEIERLQKELDDVAAWLAAHGTSKDDVLSAVQWTIEDRDQTIGKLLNDMSPSEALVTLREIAGRGRS